MVKRMKSMKKEAGKRKQKHDQKDCRQDHHFMGLALELAAKGKGRTSPNPSVGAVIVRDGEVVGKGYHKKAGKAHAEISAIRSVKDKRLLKGSTLYITMEPCSHYGRTGPCTDAAIKAGISRVVAAMIDPNPISNGRGFQLLRNAGIKVRSGVREDEARRLNEAYISFITTKKPFVLLKAAMSMDGKIATRTGSSKWISSKESRRYAHKLRNDADAVMVGINTALHDNPRLTCRIRGGKDPLRLILDSRLRIPLDSNILSDGNAMMATTNQCDKEKKKKLEEMGIGVIVVNKRGKVRLKKLMKELSVRGIINVMIEGGSEVAASAVKEGIVDKVVYFVAPKIIGGSRAKTPIGGRGAGAMEEVLTLRDVELRKTGCDVIIEGYL
ncbi:MAG: bifunctional diaminohydroxyphosphoribosylaminopyrimidine deaminase/5-amino-6-(5-phosphoribosylamino)uracil reductase RibD [Candidatus Woesearchaeota archaeon]